jgi:hypothetical protein
MIKSKLVLFLIISVMSHAINYLILILYGGNQENDWVILEDGTHGRVVTQSADVVRLVLLGGSYRTYYFCRQGPFGRRFRFAFARKQELFETTPLIRNSSSKAN